MSEAELVARLGRLERDNRRLKRFAMTALVIAAAIGTMAATQPVPNVIKAHEFDVVGATGNARIRLSADNPPGMASIDVLSSDGKDVVEIFSSGSGSSREGTISVEDLRGNSAIMSEGSHFFLPGLWVNGKSPTISLSDKQGYTMDLGSTGLVTPATGETHQTSADSIVMFGSDKKHHVIWEAPN